MGNIVLSKGIFFRTIEPKAIPRGGGFEMAAGIGNLSKSCILRALCSSAVFSIFSRANYILFSFNLKHSLGVRPKLLNFISPEFLLHFDSFSIMAWTRHFVFVIRL